MHVQLRRLTEKRATRFTKKEVGIVAHGGGHQATIVVVDVRE
jgi:hypothetical protein